jgi:ketosteroid isomerase-like protein
MVVDMSTSPISLARSLHAALEAGEHGDALRRLFTDDATIVERPNALKPRGARLGLDDLLAASRAGAAILTRQTYAVHAAHEDGPLATLRLTWTGEIARDAGPFRRGQVLTAHVAQFVETRDGRIARIETYDCYEPFEGADGDPARAAP